VEFVVTLGPLDYKWTEFDVVVDGSSKMDVEIPTEAWLDASAETYVSRLRARVLFRDDAGFVTRKKISPSLFLIWDLGPTSPPWLMTPEEMAVYAPFGTTDEAVQKILGSAEGDQWATPPIWELGATEDDDHAPPLDKETPPRVREGGE
jgi:hypothetical protein